MGNWSTVPFGKYQGKTLPQVILHDPDYFYWCVGNRIFESPALKEQAAEIADKASRIKSPKPDPENWRIKYLLHSDGKFLDFYIVPTTEVKEEQDRFYLRNAWIYSFLVGQRRMISWGITTFWRNSNSTGSTAKASQRPGVNSSFWKKRIS